MPFPVSLLNYDFPLPENVKVPVDGEPHEREYAELINKQSAYVKEAVERDKLCKREYNEQQVQHRVLSQLPLDEEKQRENNAYLYQKQMRALYARKKMIEVNSDAGRIIGRATETYKEACKAAELAKKAAEEAAKKAEQEAMDVGEGSTSTSEQVEESVAGPSGPSTSTQTN